jgi:MFS family permease
MTPAGFLGDKIGHKPCVLISHGFSLLATFLFISSRDFFGMLISRLLEGLASGFGGLFAGEMGGANWQALIADIVPPERRGSVMGLIGALIGAVAAPSSWVGGYFYQNYSPELPFQFNIILRALAMGIFTAILKEPQRRKQA